MSQNRPNQLEIADGLIEYLMRTLLGVSPGATRVRLAAIEESAEPVGGLTYTATNSVAVRGRAIGITPRNRPLSDWRAFLPAVLADRCTVQLLPRAGVPEGMAALRSRLPSSRLTYALVSPINCAPGYIKGALFILWDGEEQPPTGQHLQRLMQESRRVAVQVAALWACCHYEFSDLPLKVPELRLEFV